MDTTYALKIIDGMALLVNKGNKVEYKVDHSGADPVYKVLVHKPDESVEVFKADRLPYAFEKACRKLTTVFDK